MLTPEQKHLYNNAYEEYRKLCFFIDRYYQSINSEDDDILRQHALFDKELIDCFMNIGSGEAKAPTSHEEEFIQSLLDHKDYLKRNFQGYLKFFRNMCPDNYKIVKEEVKISVEKAPIPLIIALKLKESGDDHRLEVINSFQEIFFSYAKLSNIDAKERLQRVEVMLSSMKDLLDISSDSIDYKVQSTQKVIKNENEKSYEYYMDELSALIGLNNVKTQLKRMIDYLKVCELRRNSGIPEVNITKHMVFTGNPGTGKTTVARILAGIYKKIGILSKGQLVEVDRSGLVGAYIGHTEEKTNAVIQRALGGILFIDEAYALYKEESTSDFGREAIATLIKAMEDNRDDFVIIVAGYPKLMERFIDSNPGLRSRFTHVINFPDYSPQEKHDIFMIMASKDGYDVTENAVLKLRNLWDESEKIRNFGNGRGVRNVYEQVITRQATRIVGIPNPSKEDLLTIKEEDIPSSLAFEYEIITSDSSTDWTNSYR